jgi:hypothetical protein
MFSHDETTLLREILQTLQCSQETATANNALLRVQAVESIAIKQLLQIIVNNTNPKPFPTSFKITQTR